jgi:hypothetical protein
VLSNLFTQRTKSAASRYEELAAPSEELGPVFGAAMENYFASASLEGKISRELEKAEQIRQLLFRPRGRVRRSNSTPRAFRRAQRTATSNSLLGGGKLLVAGEVQWRACHP